MFIRQEKLVVGLCGAIATCVFFRYQLADGFTRLFSERYDGFIEISLLEHWYNVFSGYSSIFSTNYFYPEHQTLGYNDAYFIYGSFYSVARFFGFDPFISSEIVNIIIRFIGFFSFYVASREIFKL